MTDSPVFTAPWNFWSYYWLCWALFSFTTFIVPELWAVFSRRYVDTLSSQVWRLEGALPGQSVVNWSAIHILITGILVVLLAWLIGHFGWAIWT